MWKSSFFLKKKKKEYLIKLKYHPLVIILFRWGKCFLIYHGAYCFLTSYTKPTSLVYLICLARKGKNLCKRV